MRSTITKSLALLTLIVWVGVGAAQTVDKAKSKPADPFAGYKKRKIEGFTVFLSDKVTAA